MSRIIAEAWKWIFPKLEQCPYIQRKELEKWVLSPHRDSEWFDTTLALLLTLLPNLQSIFIDGLRTYTHRTEYLLNQIALANQASKGEDHALSRLVSLDQTYEAGGHYSNVPIDFYLPLTGLPSVRRISGERVKRGSQYTNFSSIQDSFEDAEGVSRMFNSGITNIKLAHSWISSLGFENVLGRIGALQDFEYEYAYLSYTSGLPGFEPRKIASSLLAHAGHSLRSLNLTAQGINRVGFHSNGNLPDRSGIGKIARRGCVFVGSLRQFQVLETVRVNNAMLIEKIHSIDTNGKTSKVHHRLIDLLPSSIEKLFLVGDLDSCSSDQIFDDLVESKAHGRMFDNLAESKRHILPRLEETNFDYFDPVASNVKHACHKVGVEFLFPTTSPPKPSVGLANLVHPNRQRPANS